MRKLVFLYCFGIIILDSVLAQNPDTLVKQKDLIDVTREVFGKLPFTDEEQSKRDSNKVYFSIIPGPSSSGNGFVTAFVAAFYLGDKKTTNMSNVYFTPYFTFSDQWVIPMRTYIWTNNNQYNLTGDYRYMNYPQESYAIGAGSPDIVQSRIDYYQFRFYQNITHKFRRDMAFGLGFQIDNYYNIKEDKKFIEGPSDFQQYGDTGLTSYFSSGLTLEGVFDSRGNTLNAETGQFLRITFRRNAPWTGSAKTWNSLYVDGRKYFKLSKWRHKVLALNIFYWSVFNAKPYFLDLPSNGWDNYGRMNRGIYRNRYRSTGLISGEAEYRTDITHNGLWGAVFFINFASPATMYTQRYPDINLASGAGLRLKFDKRTNGNIGLDAAVSRNYWTWYILLFECF